jgi:hypothetical protein
MEKEGGGLPIWRISDTVAEGYRSRIWVHSIIGDKR